MKKPFPFIAIFIYFFVFSAPAFSGSFKVNPVKVFLDSKKKTDKLLVKNMADEDLTLQMSVFSWKQDAKAEDVYEPTGDIVVTPKILTLEKGEERIIRIGTEKRGESQELSYRVYLEELPVKKPGKMEIMLPLRIGVPIFVAPAREKLSGLIEGMEVEGGKLKATVRNDGKTHLFLSTVKASGEDANGAGCYQQDLKGWYLLPGVSKTYLFDIPPDVCPKLKAITLEVKPEKGVIEKRKTDIKESACPK